MISASKMQAAANATSEAKVLAAVERGFSDPEDIRISTGLGASQVTHALQRLVKQRKIVHKVAGWRIATAHDFVKAKKGRKNRRMIVRVDLQQDDIERLESLARDAGLPLLQCTNIARRLLRSAIREAAR